MAIGEASSFAPDAAKAEQSAKEIFKLLDKEPKIDSYSEDGCKLQEVIEGLSYMYHNIEC